MEAALQGPGAGGGPGGVEHGAALGGGEQAQRVDAGVGLAQGVREQLDVVAAHPLHGGGQEEILAGAQEEGEALAALHDAEREIELAGPGIDPHRPRLQVPERIRQRVLHAVQVEHHLEEGRVAEIPLHAERVHEPVEGHVLVGERLQGGGAHLGQERGEARGRLHAAAQHQGVDEEAHQALERRVGAARDRGADAEVALARVAMQQRAEGGAEHHEGRHLVLAAEAPHGLGQRGWQGQQGRLGAALGAHRGPRQVRGEIQQRRRLLELALPVLQRPGLLGRDGGQALPRGVVRVLQRQGGEHGLRVAHERRVNHPQLAHQHVERASIEDHVVDHEQQHVPVR